MELRRSLLLPYAVEDMFDLIERAEAYPQFLPWCTGATILERSDDWVAARIEFSYLKFRFGFQTRNPKRRPEWLQVRLVEGPFKRFQGEWQLKALGRQGCRVDFEISYEIADGFFDRLSAPAADLVSRSMMDAFVKRAEDTLAVRLPEVRSPPALPTPTPIPTLHIATETAMTPSDTAHYDAVRASPLAAELSPEQTAVLAGLLTLHAVPARHVLASEGGTGTQLFVIVEGALGVVKNAGTPEETLLATLNAGDFAHELGFLDGSVRYASLMASTDARVLVLERTALESLIATHPQILYRVMCAIVRAVHRVQTRLSMHASELSNYIYKVHGRY